jgi:hypothetical protein
MKLTILERLMLLGILPKESNIISLRIIADLRKELSFSEEEIKDAKIIGSGMNVTWDSTKDPVKDIEIGPAAFVIISDSLKGLDKTNKLTEQHISVYERFVEGEKLDSEQEKTDSE